MSTITVLVDDTLKQKMKKDLAQKGVTLTFAINQFFRAYTEGKIEFEVNFHHDKEYQDVSSQLTRAIKKKVKKAKLASLEEQLKDI